MTNQPNTEDGNESVSKLYGIILKHSSRVSQGRCTSDEYDELEQQIISWHKKQLSNYILKSDVEKILGTDNCICDEYDVNQCDAVWSLLNQQRDRLKESEQSNE